MNKLNILVSAIVSVVVVLVGFSVFGGKTVVEKLIPGATPGTEISSDSWTVNGLEHQYRSRNFNVGTTTPCEFVTPSATSSLVRASLRITNGTTTATTWAVYKSAVTNSTTTSLSNRMSLGSGAYGSFVYTGFGTSTAGYSADQADVFAPNSFVNWGVTGILGFTNPSEMQGRCTAEFIVL